MGTSLILKFWTIIQALVYLCNVSSSQAIIIRKVTTATQFQGALDKANPGDVIELQSINQIFFEGGEFIATKSGKPGYPITIKGISDNQVSPIQVESFPKNSSGTTALTISGDFWNIKDITFSNHEYPHVGIRVDGNNNYLSSLTCTAVETGIYLNGIGNTLVNSVIKAMEGTGIYLKGGGHNVTWNTVEGQDWGMYFAEASCCDLLISNTVKGPVMVEGVDHYLEDNIIKGDLLVTSCSNKFTNVFVYSKNYQGQFEDNCEGVNAGVVYVR